MNGNNDVNDDYSGPMSPTSTTRPTRRAYSRADYHYLATHYSHAAAATCAAALGRTVGSVKYFINQHPELKKRRPA